jgi:GT2 family glycosyltransferase
MKENLTHSPNIRILANVEGLWIGGGFYAMADTASSEERYELDGDFIPGMPDSVL